MQYNIGFKTATILIGVCILLLFNVILQYWDFKFESTPPSSFSRLRARKVHKYSAIYNSSGILTNSLPISPLISVKERYPRNSTVIPANASISLINITTTNLGEFAHHFTTSPTTIATAIAAASAAQVNNSFSEIITIASMPFLECKDPDPADGGPIKPNKTLESLDIVEARLAPLLKLGGAFEPKDCKPKHHVAIVVPFRDRYAHLSIFLRNIHPFLMKQRIAYRVFIVEQTNGRPFNRAALMNIGVLEALKLFKWDCFIFHDVDLLPLDDRNLYNCPHQPRHMSVAIDTLNYKLPYRTIFGGVSAMTREHFFLVNGFSNSYFGWGGEDDDMSNRLKHANLFISRYPVNIARYTMLKHQKEKANPKRYENLVNGISKIEMDGINSINYTIYIYKEFPAFTWYLAELKNFEQKITQ